MELIKVDTTKTFGVPRLASFYALMQTERELIEEVEKEKKEVKESKIQEEYDENFSRLQKPLERLFPLVNPFLTSMPMWKDFFNKYALTTSFTRGFEILPNKVTLLSAERSALTVRPHFHMRYNEPANLLECWSYIGLVGEGKPDKRDPRFEVIENALNIMYKGSDGIEKPRIDKMTVSATGHVPRVLNDMFTLVQRLDNFDIEKAGEVLERLRYQRTHQYTGNDPIIIEALEGMYNEMLGKLVNPNIKNN